MKQLNIIYWSGTGNTEQMAKLIAEGFKNQGNEANVIFVEEADKNMIIESKYIALGCPSMGAEVLEEELMEPFVESLANIDFSGKVVALFGSYDWGDGEWMRNWVLQMESFGANLIDNGLIIHLTPEGSEADKCKQLGEKIAKA